MLETTLPGRVVLRRVLREGCGRRREGDGALVGVLVGEELYEWPSKSPEGVKVVREDLKPLEIVCLLGEVPGAQFNRKFLALILA